MQVGWRFALEWFVSEPNNGDNLRTMKDQEELNISPVALPRASEAVNLICDLLRSATSLAVVTDFLKSKNISSSAGSWDEMKEKRLLPALQQQKITVADLKRLLSEAEEFGHNHIFLYQG